MVQLNEKPGIRRRMSEQSSFKLWTQTQKLIGGTIMLVIGSFLSYFVPVLMDKMTAKDLFEGVEDGYRTRSIRLKNINFLHLDSMNNVEIFLNNPDNPHSYQCLLQAISKEEKRGTLAILYALKGNFALQSGKYKDAVKDLESAHNLEPNDKLWLRLLVLSYKARIKELIELGEIVSDEQNDLTLKMIEKGTLLEGFSFLLRNNGDVDKFEGPPFESFGNKLWKGHLKNKGFNFDYVENEHGNNHVYSLGVTDDIETFSTSGSNSVARSYKDELQTPFHNQKAANIRVVDYSRNEDDLDHMVLAKDDKSIPIKTNKTNLPPTKKFALVVGINNASNYNFDAEPLMFAESDARDMAEILEYHGYETTLLTGENVAWPKILEKIMREAITASTNDQMMIYFAGHGFTDRMQKRYLLGGSGKKNSVISLEHLVGTAALHPGESIILADACFNKIEAQITGWNLSEFEINTWQKSVPVLMSGGNLGKQVIESNRLKGGVFTHAVINYLGQKSSGSLIDFKDFFKEVSSETERLARDLHGFKQAPQLNIFKDGNILTSNTNHELDETLVTEAKSVNVPKSKKEQ